MRVARARQVNDWLKAEYGAKPSSNNRQSPSGPDNRPAILITTEEFDVNDQAIDVLNTTEDIYQRNFRLASVVRDTKPKGGAGIRRAHGTPVIRPMQAARLREILTREIHWEKSVKDQHGKPMVVKAHPPAWSINAILAREEWPDIPYLVGIVETPTLRCDGSTIETPGYDAGSGLLYVPNCQFPEIPRTITQEDAKAVAKTLLALVAEFPFKVGHNVVWLAGLLTVLVRFLIDGPCPLFLLEANVSGAGKSLLCDLIAVIATGRPMTRTRYYHDSVEMDKQIVATALAGDRVVLFDNLENGGAFGNSAVDAALTGRTYRGRVLGKSEMTPDLDLICVFFASGNNPVVCADVIGRLMPARLESSMERPDERSGFQIADLLGYAAQERPNLVIAALMIIRGYILAGSPDQQLTPVRFTAWSALVRSAVHWATGKDPAIGREGLKDCDPARAAEAAFVEGWFELQTMLGQKGMTVAEMLKYLKEDTKKCHYSKLRDAMSHFWSKIKSDELPTPGSVAKKIQSMRNKPYGDKWFRSLPDVSNITVWAVECTNKTTDPQRDKSHKSDISHTPRVNSTNQGQESPACARGEFRRSICAKRSSRVGNTPFIPFIPQTRSWR